MVLPLPERGAAIMRPQVKAFSRAVTSAVARALCNRRARRASPIAHERSRTQGAAAARLDHRRLRGRRGARGVRGAGRRRAFPIRFPSRCPKGLRPEFALAIHEIGDGFARAGIVKDAGDDPDVTHGALIVATVRLAPRRAPA